MVFWNAVCIPFGNAGVTHIMLARNLASKDESWRRKIVIEPGRQGSKKNMLEEGTEESENDVRSKSCRYNRGLMLEYLYQQSRFAHYGSRKIAQKWHRRVLHAG